MNKFSRRNLYFIFVTLLLCLSASVVYATTITVDGDPSDWPGASLVANDPDEAGTSNSRDIENVYLTNNSTTLFIRFDTYANTRYNDSPQVEICLDTDNNAGTGANNECNSTVNGIEYKLIIVSDGQNPATLSISLDNCIDGSCDPAAGETVAVDFAATVTELSVLLSDIGINSTNCGAGCTMGLKIFFDNPIGSEADDVVPDSGTIEVEVGSGSPTAITLNNLNTTSTPGALPFTALALSFGLFTVTSLFVILKRRQTL